MKISEDEKVKTLFKERESEKIESFQKTQQSLSKSLELFAYDYSVWDEMVKFINTGDLSWTKENIDVSLETYDANAAFVFRQDYSLSYKTNNLDENLKLEIGPIQEIVENSAQNNFFTHFYIRNSGKVFEVRAAPIQPSNDINRETEPKGYFFVLKHLSEEYLKELAIQSSSQVWFEEVDSEEIRNNENDSFIINTALILNGWDSKPVVSMISSSDFSAMKTSSELFSRQMIAFISFTILVLIIVSYFLLRHVSNPLKLISLSLQEENPSLIHKLSSEKVEFGKLSNLISQFFNQKENLEQEIIQRKLTEISLQRSEEKYRKIFENVQDIFYQADLNGVITSISPSIERYSEYKPEEVIGRQIMDLYYDPSQREILLQKMNKSGEVTDHEIKLLTKTGKIVQCSVNAHLLKDDSGNIIGVEGSLRDINERKLHELKILKLSQAIEQSPVSVLITDIEGKIEYVNPRFTELSGYSLDEIKLQNPALARSHYTSEEIYNEVWNTITAGNEWSGEIQNHKKNGEIYWENVLLSPIKNSEGEITNYLGIKEDITDRKKIVEELKSAKFKAEEMNRLKTSFLANMSHELRTPLIGILGFSEILSSEMQDQEWKSMVDKIHQGGKRLLETLNLVLDLSKHESQKADVKLEATDVIELLEECVSLLEPIADKKNLYVKTLFPKEKLISVTDRKYLQSIFNNLIGNALKYTAKGGVSIELSSDTINNNLVFTVSDTGIGIAEKNLKIIFDEFRQVSEGLNRQYEGTGLGLAITQKFVQKLNGKISVSSTEGIGSVFTVTLPSNFPVYNHIKTELIEPAKHNIINYSQADKKILFVDDDLISRELVKIFLTNHYEVDTVYDSMDAMKLINSFEYSLVLLDINLGGFESGIDILRLIHKKENYRNIPVIAVTAYAMENDEKRFLAEGFNDYLAKPFLKNEFLDMIKSYMSNNTSIS